MKMAIIPKEETQPKMMMIMIIQIKINHMTMMMMIRAKPKSKLKRLKICHMMRTLRFLKEVQKSHLMENNIMMMKVADQRIMKIKCHKNPKLGNKDLIKEANPKKQEQYRKKKK